MATDITSSDRASPKVQVRLWLAIGFIGIVLLAIAFALDVIIPRIAFPFLDQSISDTWLAMPWVVLTAGACLLWRRRTRKLPDRCATALAMLVPAYLLGILATHALNAVGDRSAPRAVAYQVVGLTHGRSSTYAELGPIARDPQWPPLETYIDALTPTPRVGDVVVVRVRGGRLGYPWVEQYGIPSRLGTR